MTEFESGRQRSLRQQWRRVRNAFDRTIGLSREEQEEVLTRLAARDPDVAEEVRELLELARTSTQEVDPQDDSNTRPDAPTQASAPNSPPPDPLANLIQEMALDFSESESDHLIVDRVLGEDRIASYVVERELGRGGMGTVFLARRADAAYEQRVAIKVMSRLSGSDAAMRFQVERQILADLDHPNIARLLDGGTTRDGHQFLVMEYIDGKPIVAHCRAQKLDLRTRLDLFTSVCNAVDHAHRRLVVHRDLKPSNILVNESGTAKLLDFGIAKLLDPEALPIAVARTQTMHRLMTPEYASPEQVVGGTVTTATDVYALGLLLYEMVTEKKAQIFDGTSFTEIETVVCDNSPESITKVVLPLQGKTSIGAPRAFLEDLDLIMCKALSKEPERRYPSAREMAADIDRLTAGEPIEARTPSLYYISRRFALRHRFGVAVGALALLTLIGFSVVISAFSVNLREQRDQARSEAQRAEAVTKFLTEAFSSPDPGQARGEDVSALQMLEAGSRQIDNGLTEEAPEIAVGLRLSLASVYKGLGFYDQAERELRAALQVAEVLEDDGITSEALNDLGDLLRQRRNNAEAEQLLERSLDLRLRKFGPESQEVAESFNNLGLVYRRAGRLDAAQTMLSDALILRREYSDENPHGVAVTLGNLALVAENQSKYQEALTLHQQGYKIKLQTRGEDHPSTLNTLVSIGATFADVGDYENAETTLRESRVHAERIFGRAHSRYGDLLNEIANVWHDLAMYDLAEEAYLESLDVYSNIDDPGMAAILTNNYASLLEERGKPKEAEPLFRQSLAARIRLFGERSGRVARARNNLGRVLFALERVQEARSELEQARDIYEEVVGRQHSDYAGTLRLLAVTSRKTGDHQQALGEIDESLEIFHTVRPGHPREAAARLVRSEVLRALGRSEEAVEEATAAFVVVTEAFPLGHTMVGQANCELAAGLADLGNPSKAKGHALSGLAILQKTFGEGAPQTQKCTSVLTRLAGN